MEFQSGAKIVAQCVISEVQYSYIGSEYVNTYRTGL